MNVAALIDRYIQEVKSSPDMKPLGPTHECALRALARRPIAQKEAHLLTKADVVEHCKARRNGTYGKPVAAATVRQDIVFLTGILKYAGSAWDDCEEVSAAPVTAALPFITKHGLIGKSEPRKRRPSEEEIQKLMNLFVEQNQHHRTEINMVDIVAFALVSTRRISEICRLRWGDVDFERGVYKIRDLKHPTKKWGNDKEFALLDPIPEIIRRQPRLSDDPNERVFPYNHKSCSQRYTDAKKRLGIEGLRFHDNRREAITRWLKILPPHKVRQISGHETTPILERVYDAPRAEDLLAEVKSLPAA